MNRYAKALALLAALPLAGCAGGAADEGGGEAAPADEAFLRVVNVEVQPLAPTDFTQLVQVTGTVRANRDVTVSAEEAGVVREILAEEGAAVAAGDPLIRIDDSILRSQVAEAEARATLAGETWERRRRLFEEDGVGSELAYLEARYQAEQATAGLAALRERLARTTVTAPRSRGSSSAGRWRSERWSRPALPLPASSRSIRSGSREAFPSGMRRT